jgi:hypothetical protein
MRNGNMSLGLERTAAAAALAGLLALASGQGANAQAIDPDTMTPRAAGTTLVRTTLGIDHYGAFQLNNGASFPNTHFDFYDANLTLEHYFDFAGQHFSVGISQGAGIFDNFKFDGYDENNAAGLRQPGLTNTQLFARYWPYIDEKRQAFVDVAAFLNPPDGTYQPTRSFNVASGAWQGSLEAGGHKGFGAHFSVDAAADVLFTGDRDRQVSSVSTDPSYALQVWANWDWSNGVRTSIGYTGSLGGEWYYNAPVYGSFPYITPTGYDRQNEYRSAQYQRFRAEVSYWWTPRVRTSLEVDHDIVAPGGYQLGVGATGAVKVLF